MWLTPVVTGVSHISMASRVRGSGAGSLLEKVAAAHGGVAHVVAWMRGCQSDTSLLGFFEGGCCGEHQGVIEVSPDDLHSDRTAVSS